MNKPVNEMNPREWVNTRETEKKRTGRWKGRNMDRQVGYLDGSEEEWPKGGSKRRKEG